ncbi:MULTISPECIES: IclR family transcriptional regulator [Rhodococcus]|uniref:IclR family transcriptional regulator n=1 Tax=Rhodococcus TaxID=1827 RepID=UPI0027DFBE85|nr:IclR family transcriptional regulator C-terminal domain-containing protein [Rhodococcus globerulus]
MSSTPVAEGMYGRAGAVVDLLVTHWPDSVGVRQIAGELGLSRTTVNRILMSLSERGASRALPSGKYRLGHRILVDAWAASHRSRLLGQLRIQIQELSARTNETALLVLLDEVNLQGRTIFEAVSSRRIRYRVSPGSRVPLDRGALGRAMLAGMPREQLARMIEQGSPTTHELETVREQSLQELRKQQFVVSREERIPGAMGICSPILVGGDVVGCIGLTIPRVREAELDVAELGSLVASASNLAATVIALSNSGFDEPITPPTTESPSSVTDRFVTVLEHAYLQGSAPIGAIGRIANCSTPAAHRLVEEMVASGLFRKSGSNLVPGVLAITWSSTLAELEPCSLLREALDSLASEVGETVAFGLLEPEEASLVLVEVCEGSKPIQYHLGQGDRLHLRSGAAGKSVLAFMEEKRSKEIIGVGESNRNPEAIHHELAVIRSDLAAVSYGEQISGAVGVAAPVFNGDQVIGAVTISTPRYRFDETRITEFKNAVRRTASSLTILNTAADIPLRSMRA